jgi:hypothetical protein
MLSTVPVPIHRAVFHRPHALPVGCDIRTRGRAWHGQVETGPRQLIGVPVDSS